ncbi:pirin family protein [Nitrogeniibacter mangrovi]|uniref:Pirin family protein n=1 Tax=Nitrogeniibacter mangrovi TaxID=2016596 RepID=A0A6C1B3J2_9RHOO|nr:pirin family protein [Nitrogeniibacter mangrovi]QID17559.1 pirin family protein [Nitrogeniibacter mangrovi]
MKRILGIHSAPQGHWVGDGFPVRTLFAYDRLGPRISPFLLLDHAGPADFPPAVRPRGVGEHPHRGMETVTIVYDGEVAHRDSTGGGGTIGPGDVQWMTAASGILHEEFHSPAFTGRGGRLEMVQLWVNLPARDKLAPPAYQTILAGDIPVVPLRDGAGQLRVIAGEFGGQRGPARTFTPIDVWDLQLAEGRGAALTVKPGRNVIVVVLRGTVRVNDTEPVRAGQFALLDRDGEALFLEADDAAALLVLSGEPIDEPIAGQGPFVMNTEDELRQAFADFRAGRFGQIVPAG